MPRVAPPSFCGPPGVSAQAPIGRGVAFSRAAAPAAGAHAAAGPGDFCTPAGRDDIDSWSPVSDLTPETHGGTVFVQPPNVAPAGGVPFPPGYAARFMGSTRGAMPLPSAPQYGTTTTPSRAAAENLAESNRQSVRIQAETLRSQREAQEKGLQERLASTPSAESNDHYLTRFLTSGGDSFSGRRLGINAQTGTGEINP